MKNSLYICHCQKKAKQNKTPKQNKIWRVENNHRLVSSVYTELRVHDILTIIPMYVGPFIPAIHSIPNKSGKKRKEKHFDFQTFQYTDDCRTLTQHLEAFTSTAGAAAGASTSSCAGRTLIQRWVCVVKNENKCYIRSQSRLHKNTIRQRGASVAALFFCQQPCVWGWGWWWWWWWGRGGRGSKLWQWKCENVCVRSGESTGWVVFADTSTFL